NEVRGCTQVFEGAMRDAISNTNFNSLVRRADALAAALAAGEPTGHVLALDDAERTAIERAIERMGWAEINAFHAELKRGQSIYEDAGGFFLRAFRRLFGLPPRDEVVTYQEAARAALKQAATGR